MSKEVSHLVSRPDSTSSERTEINWAIPVDALQVVDRYCREDLGIEGVEHLIALAMRSAEQPHLDPARSQIKHLRGVLGKSNLSLSIVTPADLSKDTRPMHVHISKALVADFRRDRAQLGRELGAALVNYIYRDTMVRTLLGRTQSGGVTEVDQSLSSDWQLSRDEYRIIDLERGAGVATLAARVRGHLADLDSDAVTPQGLIKRWASTHVAESTAGNHARALIKATHDGRAAGLQPSGGSIIQRAVGTRPAEYLGLTGRLALPLNPTDYTSVTEPGVMSDDLSTVDVLSVAREMLERLMADIKTREEEMGIVRRGEYSEPKRLELDRRVAKKNNREFVVWEDDIPARPRRRTDRCRTRTGQLLTALSWVIGLSKQDGIELETPSDTSLALRLALRGENRTKIAEEFRESSPSPSKGGARAVPDELTGFGAQESENRIVADGGRDEPPQTTGSSDTENKRLKMHGSTKSVMYDLWGKP